MHEESPLYEQLARATADDPAGRERAYAELTRLITVFVRVGMGSRLRNHRESVDVSQSIVKSFVADHGSGKLHFDNDGSLIRYLRTVVQSKLSELARHDNAAKRTPTGFLADSHGASPSPQSEVLGHEAERAIADQLSDADREIARLRLAGLEWDQIAARLGQSPESLRKRWSRLAARLSGEKG